MTLHSKSRRWFSEYHIVAVTTLRSAAFWHSWQNVAVARVVAYWL